MRIGHKCTDYLNTAQIMARAAYLRINDTAVDMFRDLGGMESLPAGFDVCGAKWLEAQREIDKSAAEGDIEKTVRLAQEYERRALAYFAAWRARMLKAKGVVP